MVASKNGVLKWGLLPILFIVSYLLIANVISGFARWLVPMPHMGKLTHSLQSFFAQKDDIDLLFIGASGYGFALNPEVIDAEMERVGCKMRSFSFGPDGLNTIEYQYVLDQIHESNPKKLSTIIFDLPAVRYGFQQIDSDRTRFFNSWSFVPAFIYELWNLPRFRRTRAIMGLKYLVSFLYEQSAVGTLHSVLLSPIESYPVPEALIRQRGFNPAFDEHTSTPQQDAQLTREVHKLKSEVDGWIDSYAEMNRTGHLARLRPVLAQADAMGVKAGVLLAPAMVHYPVSEPLQGIFAEQMPEVPLWHYNDPGRALSDQQKPCQQGRLQSVFHDCRQGSLPMDQEW